MIVLKEKTDLNDFTAIMPSIGVGNVAQLSVDLIIATLQLKRIGAGWHLALMPVFGPPAYHHDMENKTLSFEVYSDCEKKLLVFQIRSPLVPQYMEDFHKEIVKFLVENQITKVIILTSSHAYEKHSVESTPYEFLCNEQFRNDHIEQLSKLTWKEFSSKIIHGGGNARNLFEACSAKNLRALVLFKYVSEGDNSSDAGQLVGELNSLQKLFTDSSKQQQEQQEQPFKLTLPLSWKLLFGNDPPELIF